MNNEDKRLIGIYKITSPSGRIYIGQSTNIEKRFIDYKFDSNYKQVKIYRSIKKYGYNNHIFEIIELCNIEDLNKRERYYQDLYDVLGLNGLNCRLTSLDDKSGRLSEETKAKMSIAAKNNSRLGRKLTQQHKNNISKALKGKSFSEEALKKIIEGKIKSLKKVINTETGIIYSHLSEAARQENIHPVTLCMYLLNKRTNKTNLKYVE